MRCVTFPSIMVMSPREENSEKMYQCIRGYARLRGYKGKPTMTNLISPLEVLSLTITPDVYIAHVTFYSVKTFLI